MVAANQTNLNQPAVADVFKVKKIRQTPTLPLQTETKTIASYIDSMRAICLLRKTFAASEAQERGFSNCTSGEEESEFRMRDALHLSVKSRTTTKNSKTVDSASLDRHQIVSMKCDSPVSPSSVSPVLQRRTEPPTTFLRMFPGQPNFPGPVRRPLQLT